MPAVPPVSFGAFVLIMRALFHSVARDFVEAPSQMLENWGWEPKVLKKISSHYETQEPLPDDLIEKLIKRFVASSRWWSGGRVDRIFHTSRYVNAGLFYLRQLFFATFDIKVHTDKGTCILEQKQRKTMGTYFFVTTSDVASGRLADIRCSSFGIRSDQLYTAME